MSDLKPLKPAWREMTPMEIEAAKLLRSVTFPFASYDKRMASTMFVKLDGPQPPQITDKQSLYLWRLIYRYRRQISHPNKRFFLKTAQELMEPPFRKKELAASNAKKTSMTAATLEEPWATQFQKAQAMYKTLHDYQLRQDIAAAKRKMQLAEEDGRIDDVVRYAKIAEVLESSMPEVTATAPTQETSPQPNPPTGNGRIISFD